jgi:hypothetical protein
MATIKNLTDIQIAKAVLKERIRFEEKAIEQQLQLLPSKTFDYTVEQFTNANTYTFIGNKLLHGIQYFTNKTSNGLGSFTWNVVMGVASALVGVFANKKGN